MTAVRCLLLTVVALTVVCGLRRHWIVVRVHGHSMTPTYTDGDLLLVRRLGTRTLVSNDVVVFRAAAAVGAIRGRDLELLVKRVAATTGEPVPADLRPHVDDDRVVPPARILVLGDNSPSLDSREFGYLPYNSVIGTVVHVIAPASQH